MAAAALVMEGGAAFLAGGIHLFVSFLGKDAEGCCQGGLFGFLDERVNGRDG